MKKVLVIVLIIVLLFGLVGGYVYYWYCTHATDEGFIGLGKLFTTKTKNGEVIDDWKYDDKINYALISSSVSTSYKGVTLDSFTMEEAVAADMSSSNTLGLSVGGAKNVENFRENIKNGYFPISTDITYNGLFYDYYFDTGRSKPSDDLFSPSYSMAMSKDPISGKEEYYMTVGLNSNIKESDFARKKLNLVVVMDISGSMSSGFSKYYYDKYTKEAIQEDDDNDNNKTKMQIANESLNLLLDELKYGDRVGIVLFDDDSYLAKPLNLVEETDIEAVKGHVLEIEARGGTNFSAGYSKGTSLFDENMLNDSEYENRIIVITDAMPNLGDSSREGLGKSVSNNAEKGIYTTFIGVGVDFNTDLIENLSNVKGSNYYSVHSSKEFKKIMSEDFDYMVTPLVFDLELKFDAEGLEIENVYGTDCKDKSSGVIMKVNTLFPSSSNSNGENKGGIVLLKLKNNEKDIKSRDVKLTVSYKDRNGKEHSNSQKVSFSADSREYYNNTGIRKGIVLTRYANVMKDWILYERSEESKFIINKSTGIIEEDYSVQQVQEILGEFERSSVELSVSDEYKEIFKNFKTYFESEMREIGDDEMKQEIEILDILINK